MAYSKTVWNNNTPPDISAENLNKMEQGIADAQFPDGGSTGQILSKTNDGTGWIDAPNSAEWGNITGQLSEQTDLVSQLDTKITMPSGGTTGQVLTKTATGQAWVDVDGLPSGGTAGQVLTKNSSTDGDASWQNASGGGGSDENIAYIETSSTASQAYAVGDYLVYNGQLYVVTAAISSGQTLTVGTNISATTVGSELTALNKGLMPYPDYANGVEITSLFPSDPRSTTTNSFTLPVNALISFVADKTSQGFTLFALVDGNKVATIPANVVFGGVAMTFPVKKGSVLSFKTDSTGATWQLRRVDYFPLVMG